MRRTVLATLCWFSLTLATLLVVLPPTLGAQEPTVCPEKQRSTAEMFSAVEQVAPDFVLTDLTGTEEGELVIYGFNNTPPLSFTAPPEAEVYYFSASSKGDEIYLVIVDKGCQILGATMHRHKFDSMIEFYRRQNHNKPRQGADLGSPPVSFRALISNVPAIQGFDSPLLHQFHRNT